MQPHQSTASADSPQDDAQSSSPIIRYDSIQGALGGRRISHPIPIPYRSLSDIPSQGQHMASESRYIYPPSTSTSVPQSHHYQYEPQPYPPSSYDTPQFSHNSLPRMRTPHSHPESSRSSVNPPQGYNSMPYMPYSQPQPQPHYPVPSGMPAASWPTPYAQYPQTPTDASLSPELVRSEPMAPPASLASGTYRAPVTSYSAQVDDASRHSSGSSSRAPSVSDSKGKQREVPPSISRSRVPEELDFHKLSETYRLILDNTTQSPPSGTLSQSLPSGLPGSEVLDRIYDFAVEGVRQFDPSDRDDQPRSTTPQQVRTQPPKGDAASKMPSKRQRTEASTSDTQKCMGCGATSTPEWRRGPLGPRTLCNACGLVYAKLMKKRGRESAGRSIMEGAAAYAAAHAAGAASGEFVQDYGLAAGSSGGLHHSHHLQQDDEDEKGLPVSPPGEGSEDGSYDDVQGRSGQGSSSRGPPLE